MIPSFLAPFYLPRSESFIFEFNHTNRFGTFLSDLGNFVSFYPVFDRIGRRLKKMNTISEKRTKNATKYVAEGFQGLHTNRFGRPFNFVSY